ncbi:MAG: hypothetical protein OZSIB_3995 [Candidatus Ozemobacter sibiricus]|uniref:Uncharacterized protein n=1 Tax=Candidatus Ozemobacter sibiricus TaxID=2268124 RepID=A0A367ZR73_9BACT|nr:MAG: hypothetical protein OZSIB_3995 [Candidatus Ozemobacter sibiricus]
MHRLHVHSSVVGIGFSHILPRPAPYDKWAVPGRWPAQAEIPVASEPASRWRAGQPSIAGMGVSGRPIASPRQPPEIPAAPSRRPARDLRPGTSSPNCGHTRRVQTASVVDERQTRARSPQGHARADRRPITSLEKREGRQRQGRRCPLQAASDPALDRFGRGQCQP